MTSLADHIERLLPDVMTGPDPIKGTDLIQRLRSCGIPAVSDQSMRYQFTQLSRSNQSALRKVDKGQGYYYSTADNTEALRAELQMLRAAIRQMARIACAAVEEMGEGGEE